MKCIEFHFCLCKDNTIEEQLLGMYRILTYRLFVDLFIDIVVVEINNIWNNLTILFPRIIISKR